ncbi:flagellar hook-length control protein FliK [Thiobaca trueperi]|uniref:Flagellar hook-length control protein FliK n=1 Tax=Thiobaca trueperi TaxID=127458 RepID=A0A4V2V1H8_9GAMM|nr:flagellar hook-length control protein FliK [Thiobaca trueperi]TCT21242.1 flagellar hook-length control protein FliK [Thiobaca trueperi]
MMQSGGVQINGAGLLSALLGGIGETGVSDPAAGQGFLDTLQTQIRSLLVDAGEDPDEIAALDAEALMAQFMALMQPPASPTAAPKLAVGEALLSITPTSTQAAATPSDLLQKLLQSAPPDGSEGVWRPTASTASDETGQTSPLLPESDLASLKALPADVVRQLLQSLPATGTAVTPAASASAEDAAQELSARLQSLPADALRQLLQSLPATGADVAPAASASAEDAAQELSARLQSLPADALRQLLQSLPATGTAVTPTASASAGDAAQELSARLQSLPADTLRQLLQSLPATGAAVTPTASASAEDAVQELSARLQSLPADALRQLLQSLPATGTAVTPVADDVVQELSERLQSLPADTLRRLLQSLPVEGATMTPGAAAGDGDTEQTAILKAVSLDLLHQISQEQSRTGDDDRQSAADLAIKARAGQPLPLLRESLPGLMADGLAQLAGRESPDLPASPTGLSLAGLSTAGATSADAPSGLQRASVLDLSKLLQPGGDARLAEQVKWFVQAGLGTAEMKLHPANLGTLDVRVTMEADKAHVQFLSPHPVVREVIEAALPRLRETLAQDGLSLGNVSVSDQAPRRGEPDQGQGRAGSGHERQNFDDFGADVSEAPEFNDSTLSVLARRLDYFV